MRSAAITFLAGVALVLPGTASAGVVDCHRYAPTFNVIITSARNMSCAAADRDMTRYRGSIRRYFTTPGGFRCSRQSGGRLGGQWRCVRGIRAYRFDFGD